MFQTPGSIDKQSTSTFRLRQKVKPDKLDALYRHFNVKSDLDLINLDRFNYIKISKKELLFQSFTMVINGFPLQKKRAGFFLQKY